MYRFLFLVAFLVFINSQNLVAEERLIVVTLKPIYLLVKQIVGNLAMVSLVSNLDSHHGLVLKPSDIQKINAADLIFYEGFAMREILLKYENAFDLSEVVPLLKARNMGSINYFVDTNYYDQHFWLNPDNAIVISKNIATKVITIDPVNAKIYKKNLQLLIEEIKHSAYKGKKKLGKFVNTPYIVVHDAYRYFEYYFAFSQPLGCFYNVQHHKTNPQLMQLLFYAIRNQKVKCIVSDGQSSVKSIKTLSNDVNVNIIDPVGSSIEYLSYPQFIDAFIDQFAQCFQ